MLMITMIRLFKLIIGGSGVGGGGGGGELSTNPGFPACFYLA